MNETTFAYLLIIVSIADAAALAMTGSVGAVAGLLYLILLGLGGYGVTIIVDELYFKLMERVLDAAARLSNEG